MKLGMIDYGRGNLRSVINACKALGHDPVLVTKASEIESMTHLIFPGQGAFGDCMDSLNRLDLTAPLRDWITSGRPYFGICVGYQLLFEASEESPGTTGLAVVPGTVKRFTSNDVKIPHMGWNAVSLKKKSSPYWQGLQTTPYFYFVHSFYPAGVPQDLVSATSCHGKEEFCAAIEDGKLLATQFHPEKSQQAGLRLLGNFLENSADESNTKSPA
jgi:imidazole glycerol phosphate synthase glutamine amidotransferase subunit